MNSEQQDAERPFSSGWGYKEVYFGVSSFAECNNGIVEAKQVPAETFVPFNP